MVRYWLAIPVLILLLSGCFFQADTGEKRTSTIQVPKPPELQPSLDTTFITSSRIVAENQGYTLFNGVEEEERCSYTLTFSQGYVNDAPASSIIEVYQVIPNSGLQMESRLPLGSSPPASDGFVMRVENAYCDIPITASLQNEGEVLAVVYLLSE